MDPEMAAEPAANPTETEIKEQRAMDRMLLYLRCLHFAPPQALALALRALEEAKARQGEGGRMADSLLAAAMEAVRRIAAEEGRGGGEQPRLSAGLGDDRPLRAAPPCRRLPMVSAMAGFRRRHPP